MGTTVATNALLERKGAKTAFLVTKGGPIFLTSRFQRSSSHRKLKQIKYI
jgi:N-methylhydantoinase A/oxoprolinase/acetone carboxylase beta subunit